MVTWTAADAPRRFPRAFACTLLSAGVFSISLLLGVGAALWPALGTVIGVRTDPYGDCTLAVEWITRAAELCAPTLTWLFFIWVAGYVRFERGLLAVLFGLRGFFCGAALRLALMAGMPSLAIAAAVHALITVLFVALVFHMRTDGGLRPLSDSISALLIVGGGACCAVIGATLLLR